MDTYTACGLAEGFIEAESEDQVIEAWQHLIDTGLVWKLQGRFGRTACDLIANHICQPWPRRTHLQEHPDYAEMGIFAGYGECDPDDNTKED